MVGGALSYRVADGDGKKGRTAVVGEQRYMISTSDDEGHQNLVSTYLAACILRGGIHQVLNQGHISVNTWGRASYYTPYESYGCTLSYGVWWIDLLQGIAE